MSGKGQGSGQGSRDIVNKSRSVSKGTKQPPAKRPISEVSNDSTLSNESMNMTLIQNQLDIITENLERLKGNLEHMIKKEDFESIVSKLIANAISELQKKIESIVKAEVGEKKELNEKITSLEFENQQLQERLNKTNADMVKRIDEMEERLTKNEVEVKDANKKSNYNEQYSRKNNIEIMNISEDKTETIDSLTKQVVHILQQKDVNLEEREIVAIHRIPSKKQGNRPVLIKTINNDVKSRIMRKRKVMKEAGYKLVDDVTTLNSGLINRLLLHPTITSAWFFNGSVYGLTTMEERIKFDIFDNIDQVIKAYRDKKITGRAPSRKEQ